MNDYQQRVVEEKVELDVKLIALRAFIKGPTFQALEYSERFLLEQQQIDMTCYSNTLGQRIALWSKA